VSQVVVMFQDGGAVMWLILAVGIVAAAIGGERAVFLFGRAWTPAQPLLDDLQKLVATNAVGQALRRVAQEPHALVARVAKAGLLAANEPEDVIRSTLEEASLAVAPLAQVRTNWLATLANVATLLGLLGTIQGLIAAFAAVGAASAEGRTGALAQGIAVAMYTTGFGLAVAIPTLLAHTALVERTQRLLDAVELTASRTLNLLAARRRELARDAAEAARRS
jgi:biopolymer transport protein ExbB/TolQ